MLGIGCLDRHALLLIPPKTHAPSGAPPPARAGSFIGAFRPAALPELVGEDAPESAIAHAEHQRLTRVGNGRGAN